MDQVEQFLQHWGVKGMHWGIRRTKESKRAANKRKAADFQEIQKLRKKKPSQLTSEELKKANERANLERNFVNLNPSKVEKGHRRVKRILEFGVTAGGLFALYKSPHGQAAIDAGKRLLGSPAVKESMKIPFESIPKP